MRWEPRAARTPMTSLGAGATHGQKSALVLGILGIHKNSKAVLGIIKNSSEWVGMSGNYFALLGVSGKCLDFLKMNWNCYE